MSSLQQKLWGKIPIGEKSKGWRIVPAFLKRVIHAFARYTPLLPSWRASLHRWRGVKVGKNSFIGVEVFIDDADPSLVEIQDDVTIIAQTTILGHAYYPMHFAQILESASKKEGVLIKQGAYIGLRTVILPGVTIGEYSIVGAGSLVTKDVPAYSMVLGVPARVVRSFSQNELIKL